MNDDLNVLLYLIEKDSTDLITIAIRIAHGMNTFNNWQYYKEDDIALKWKELLHRHNYSNHIIVRIEEINYISC